MNLKPTSLIISILLLGVSSCSTPYELRKSKPQLSYVTAKPAKDVMKCIRDKWRGHQTTVYEEKTDDGWMVRHDDVFPGATVAIVVIEGTAPAVKVDYYHRTNRIKLHRLEDDIMSCK